MSSHDLPPLPEVITQDMQSLRSLEPSAALIERAMAGLTKRSSLQTARKDEVSKPKSDPCRHSMWVFMIPVSAIAAGALFFVSNKLDQRPREDMVRVEEKTVSL